MPVFIQLRIKKHHAAVDGMQHRLEFAIGSCLSCFADLTDIGAVVRIKPFNSRVIESTELTPTFCRSLTPDLAAIRHDERCFHVVICSSKLIHHAAVQLMIFDDPIGRDCR